MKSSSPSTSTGQTAIALPEILSALSFALDLTEGAVPGHALRSCLIGMRLAEAIDLPKEMLTQLYYALLLKDTGCSSNAARMTEVTGGDDRAVKARAKLAGGSREYRSEPRLWYKLWRNVRPGAGELRRARRVEALSARRKITNREMIELRCERGASILRKLEIGDLAAEAVRRLDEHWDGTGFPEQSKEQDTPLLARICAVAQNLDVFAMVEGEDAAFEVVRKRSGTWFDPEIVKAAGKLHETGKLWRYCRPECPVDVTRRAVVSMDPLKSAELGPERIDAICEAFADVVDAKSPFTFRHSLGVAEVAEAMAKEMNLLPERRLLVRRAALLHDLGKLGVPNTILDKPGSLTQRERAIIAEHPLLTYTILERVSSFDELAQVAGEHHERLDGTGYPQGLTAADLRLESRLLAVADSFAALAEERPYRGAMSVEEILRVLSELVPDKLDAGCFEALQAVSSHWHGVLPAIFTTPQLTDDWCMPRDWSGVPAVLTLS